MRYARLSLFALCGALLVTLHAWAADPTVKAKVEPVWQAKELPLSIGMGNELELPVPAVPARDGYLRVLRVQARLDAPANGGWNTFLLLEINGQKVYLRQGEQRNAPQRVLNRDLLWKPAGMETEELLMRGNHLNVVFAPDFKQFDTRLAHEGEEAFWFVLDISDLLNANQPNTIKFGNIAQPQWFGGRDAPIVLGDVSIGYLPLSYRTAAQKTLTRSLPKGKTITRDGYQLTVTPRGGLAIKVGKEHYLLETALTWPDGDFNWLSCPDRKLGSNRQEWRVVKVDLNAKGGQIVAQGKSYRLTRSLKFDGPRVRMNDRIQNLTNADLGLELGYYLSSGALLEALNIAGFDDPNRLYVDQAGANPTVFAGQKASGLGLLVEDDVFRNQLRLRAGDNETRAYSTQFGLAPKAAYTVEWTLYPSKSNDYWSFINQVRRDWNVNFTIDGPFDFFGNCASVAQESLESIRARTNPRQVRLAAMHPWTNYQYPYSREEHKKNWIEAQSRVHQVDPKIKCLVMMEPPLESRVHKDKVDQDPYRDSIVFNPDGTPAFDLSYGPNYIGKTDFDAGWRLVWRYPTLTNSWMKYMDYDVDFAMKECGADGMYIDCFSYGFSRDWCRYTYDRWDGHTVDLDPKTHRIIRKYADLALLSAPGQQRIVERIQAAGGVVVANSEPCTANMRKLRVNRFVETGSGARYDAGTHLYTPIALGFPWYSQPPSQRNAQGFIADVVENLKYGALYYYYGVPATYKDFGVVNRMFPFTPRELHSGWLVGEERIITTKSGQYGWGDKSGAKVFHYALDGAETLLNLKPRVVGKANVWDIKLQPGEIVIMERTRQ